MESEVSVWYLIANAGVLVQLVMLLLALASIISWALIFQRLKVFRKAKQAQYAFEERFWSGMDLGQLYREVNSNPTPFSGMESLFRLVSRNFPVCASKAGMPMPSWKAPSVRCEWRFPASRSGWRCICRFLQRSAPPALCRSVWHGLGHHEFVSGAGSGSAGDPRHGSPRYFRGIDSNGNGPVCGHPRGDCYNRFSAISDALLKNYETFADEFSSILHRRVHNSEQSAA